MKTLTETRASARRQAALLAKALTPLIAALDAEPMPERPAGPLLEKAMAVSDALTRLENDRFTRGEAAARDGLERAARTLREVLKTYRRTGHG